MIDSSPYPKRNSPYKTLRRFMQPKAIVERCELCSFVLPNRHNHLVDPIDRNIVCSCDPCAILFDGNPAAKYRRVPREISSLPDFEMTEAQWDALLVPIGMAFFFHSSPVDKTVAYYPSPAGATESLLPLDRWEEIVAVNPELAGMQSDVEALLVNRIGRIRQGVEAEYFIAPIDECFRLVGLIRTHWRGLAGGSEVWQEIENFFVELRERARPRGRM